MLYQLLLPYLLHCLMVFLLIKKWRALCRASAFVNSDGIRLGDKSEGMGVLISGSNSSIRRRGNGFALFTSTNCCLCISTSGHLKPITGTLISTFCALKEQLTVAAHQQSMPLFVLLVARVIQSLQVLMFVKHPLVQDLVIV